MRHVLTAFFVSVSLAPSAEAKGPQEALVLPPGSFAVSWKETGLGRTWLPGEERRASVTVKNLSPHAWPDALAAHVSGDGRNAVRLSYCWKEETGEPTEDCWRVRADLAASVAPGAEAVLGLTITAPSRPGRFKLEFDLVQEMVTWFRLQGAQTLAVPAIVRPPAAPLASRARWVGFLRVVGALALTVGLLFFAGFGVVPLVLPPRLRGVATMFMPVIGLATLSVAGHTLAFASVGTDVTLVPILLACAALNVGAWRRGLRPRFPRAHLPVWLVFVVALASTASPLVVMGDLTAMGGEIDVITYVVRADWMRGHGMLVQPDRAPSEDYLAQIARDNILNGLRQGDQFVLAAAGSLAGQRAYRLFSILMSVFHALAPLGVFALARHGLRVPLPAAWLAAALVGVQPLAHYVALNSFLSHNSALALFPFTALAVLVALRNGPRRRLVLAGLLVGALSTFYTLYVVYLVPVVALLALNQWLGMLKGRWPRGAASAFARVAGRVLAIALVSLVLFPVGWKQGLVGLEHIRTVTSGAVGDVALQGNILVYPHPGEAFGLVGHANAAHALRLREVPRPVATGLLAAVALAIAWGIVVSARSVRLVLAGLPLMAAAGALHQRFGMGDPAIGYPYGYFKVVSLFAPLLLIPFAHACVWCWRAGSTGRLPGLVLRVAAAGLAGLVFLLSAFHVRQQAPALAFKHLVVDRAMRDLDGLGNLLPRDEGLVMADPRWPGRAWTVYLLEHGNVFDRLKLGLPLFRPEARSRRVLRYAFVASDSGVAWTPGEPWGVPGQHDVLWSNQRFMLLRRTDGALGDLRLSHPDTRVALEGPIRVDTGRTLSIAGPAVPSGYLSQELEWAADWLELTLTAPHGGVLHVGRGSGTERQALSAGTHTLRFPAERVLTFELEPPDEEARLWGVKALPADGR